MQISGEILASFDGVEALCALYQVTEVPSNVCLVGIDPDVSGAIAVLKTASNTTQAEVITAQLLVSLQVNLFLSDMVL